ncbi:MAG: hypothetical protein M3458_01155, partial [Acidobacteriota bacterium]|nr:hypothetical protein [Acidobacteriota bacterium]
MNITTQSKEARTFFNEGLTKYDHAQVKGAVALFQQAVEADPQFALAYLFLGLADFSMTHIRQAAELVDNVTEAERLLILSYKEHFESRHLKAVEHIERAVELL